MRINYVLVDYENVQVKSLHRLEAEHFRVTVFLGPNNTKLPVELVLAMHQLGDRARYMAVEASGNNALDFQIAYYLGHLVTIDPAGYFHIISKDTGFDPLIQHLKSKKIACARSTSIEEMPCFQQTVSTQNQDTSLDELLKLTVGDLISRNSARPRAVKTLKNAIQARFGQTPARDKTEQVFNLLVKKGYVKVNGTKVTYTLPAKP